MGKEVIMLAAKYNPDKQKFPAYVSEKLDGVAADIYTSKKDIHIRSRQGEPISSVMHLISDLDKRLREQDDTRVGMHFIGELYIPGKDFKDISGSVRRQSEDCPEMEFHVYDFYIEGKEDMEYVDRMAELSDTLPLRKNSQIKLVPIQHVKDKEDVEVYKRDLMARNPKAEGIMVRQSTGKETTYQIGKRPKGMAKYKVTETADLEVVGFEEAIDAKTKAPLNMVGRIVCKYKGREIGVGPGCLTHPERREIWANQSAYLRCTAEIAYMPDDSYEALREPRFLHWRPDKD